MLVRIERKTLLKHYPPGHNVWKMLDGEEFKTLDAKPWTKNGIRGYDITDGENRASVLENQVVVLY